MILAKGLPHVFLRPSYFMDNLITTLYKEIQENRRIFLPSGRLKLNWIDVDDIGAVCAQVFADHAQLAREVLTLTNTLNQGFGEVVGTINHICDSELRYESPSIFRYVSYMRTKQYSFGYIGIMLLLHFLPRFEKEPEIHGDIRRILNRNPRSIAHFVEKNKGKF